MRQLSRSVGANLLLERPAPVEWEPDADQKKGIKWLLAHACGALFADPGVGKTSISLGAFKILKAKGLVRKALVIAPRRVIHEVWPQETLKWLDFNGITYQILHGPKKDERLNMEADLHLVNLEGLEWLLKVEKIRGKAGRVKAIVDRRRFKALGYDLLIIDELSKFKHTNTVRFKALREVHNLFGRRWGLTGSPASNGLMGLFGEAYILDEGRSLGPYITGFRDTYFDESYNGYTYTLKEGAEKKIYHRLKPLVLRMEAKGLPPVVDNDIMIELPDEVRQVYDDLHDDLITKIDSRIVVAANAGVASGKCRQVASGGLYWEPELKTLLKHRKLKPSVREAILLHNEKTDAVEDLLDELQGKPLLVGYDFNHDLDRLKKRFGKDMPYIGKGVSDKRAGDLLKLWNAGKLPLLAGHPQSIGHGLNMQGDAFHVCWYSPTWDYELYDQFIRRVRRRGSKATRIFNHRILAKGTVDEAIRISLERKETGQNALFKALQSMRRRPQ